MSNTTVELFELAIHFGMELYPLDLVSRQRYVEWYIETKGGTELPPIITYTNRIDTTGNPIGEI